MLDVITVGTALVDVFIHSAEMTIDHHQGQVMLCQPLGDKLTVESLVIRSGGGATNTAAGFQRLGLKTAVVAEIGQDMLAQVVDQELHQDQVETRLLIREKREQTGSSVILVGKDGQRTALVYRGAASELEKSDLPIDELSSTRWIHLSSVGGRAEVVQAIFDIAHHYQVGLSWNPGRLELEAILDSKISFAAPPVQILLLNKEEWEMLTPFQEKLKSTVPQIVVTNGAHGGTIWTTGQPAHKYQAASVTSVDDTGAGDAFGTGFVAAHLHGKTPHQALAWAIANSAAVVQQIGAKPGLLTHAEIEKIGTAAHD